MKKINKLFLAAGSIAAVAAPVAAVVSCGSGSDDASMVASHVVKTTGYPDSMNKLVSGDISVAGAWGDARTAANDQAEAKKSLVAVGVEKRRIANDGIQAREDLGKADVLAVQKLFVELIKESQTNTALQVAGKSLFKVYSHDGYTPLNGSQSVGVMDSGEAKTLPTNSKATSTDSLTSIDLSSSEFFEAGDATNFAGLKTRTGKSLRVLFIPSNDATKVGQATEALNKFLTSKGITATITVTADYNTAAEQLESKQTELAFLPVDTWYEHAPHSQFIVQAARPTQVAIMDVTGAAAALPGAEMGSELQAVELMNKYGQLFLREVKNGHLDAGSQATQPQLDAFKAEAAKDGTLEHKINEFIASKDVTDTATYNSGSYEAWIYANKDNVKTKPFYDAVSAAATKDGWKVDFETIDPVSIYGFTSTTSSSSYIYPELWFHDHFNGFGSFQ